jgi:hypothetical protein
MKSSTPVKVWSLDKDKEYFVGLWRAVKGNWKQNLVVLIGLACLLTVTLLSLEAKVIDAKVWEASVVVVMAIMAILLRHRIRRRAEVEKVVQHDFAPVSLGTLWFSFALTLWISQQIRVWYTIIIEIFFSLGALAFLVAVFSRSMRKFLNTRAAAIVMPLTFVAFVFGFALGWLPALSQVSGVILEMIVYFGSLWVVAMLLVMFRDVKNELARILFVVFFLIAAVIRFCEHNIIGIIGGITLTGIAVLLYLVATGRVHPYGEVSEQ